VAAISMLLHVIEKIRATQNDFRNFPLDRRKRRPETKSSTLVSVFHYQVAHKQLEDKKSGGVQSQAFSL
jgi:hypothetical protein